MKKHIVIILLLIISGFNTANARDNLNFLPAKILEQIPYGWHLFASAKGDLSQDNIDDYAIIIEKNEAEPHEVTRFYVIYEPPYLNPSAIDRWKSVAAPRHLQVYFSRKDGTFSHVFSHSDWVERGDFGSLVGDSFNGLAVERGAIVMKSFGGSIDKTARTIRVRFQENKWRMIGFTERHIEGSTLFIEQYDLNLLTHKIKIDKWTPELKIVDRWEIIGDKSKIYLNNIMNAELKNEIKK